MKNQNGSSYLCSFTQKKERSLSVSSLFLEHHNKYHSKESYKKYVSMRECGSYLAFARNPLDLDETKLVAANFCRLRLCPMCSWRRELKLYSQMMKTMEFLSDSSKLKNLSIPEKYKGRKFRFLMVTFTLKNCPGNLLNETIDIFQHAYSRVLMRSAFIKNIVFGHYKALEVTYNQKEKSFHPHIHCIWAVSEKYFKSKELYITQKELSRLWMHAADLDYIPICDIRKIRPKEGFESDYGAAVAEVCKYTVKDSDYVLEDLDESLDVLSTLDYCLKGRRLVSFNGLFQAVRKAVCLDDPLDGDLTDMSESELDSGVDFIMETFIFRNGYHFIAKDENLQEFRKSIYGG